jgi:hypothetical protein
VAVAGREDDRDQDREVDEVDGFSLLKTGRYETSVSAREREVQRPFSPVSARKRLTLLRPIRPAPEIHGR